MRCAAIADMLTTTGFAVTVAASGTEALGLLDREMRFDLLLADYTMPGHRVTGLELAQHHPCARRRKACRSCS